MADYSDLKVEDLVKSIGWHLLQGEQLSASYARVAEEAKKEEHAAFFRGLEELYRSARNRGSVKGVRPDDDMDPNGWWRPPYWG